VHPAETVLVVTFRLAGLAPEAYAAHCAAIAPTFAALPGLRSKLWLAGPQTGTYGGVYTWESEEAMRAYLAGPVFAALRENPAMARVKTRTFALLDTATRVTGALEPAAA